MTPAQQVVLHEQVQDARRVLLGRSTEEARAIAGLLSSQLGLINERIRLDQAVGLGPHRLKRACAAIVEAGS